MNAQQNIKDIIEKSGNNFHCEVANYLRNNGWEVLLSPYYLDGITNKPREIDLVAERPYHFKTQEHGQMHFTTRLFIECKYIASPSVFWFDGRDKDATYGWLAKNTPLRTRDNSYTNEHHYLRDEKIAKLFASGKGQGPERDPIYAALNQSLNASIHLKGKSIIRPSSQPRVGTPQPTIEMPVVICNSFEHFYRLDVVNPTEPKPMDEDFQLETNYAYLGPHGQRRYEYFLIDMVDFSKIDRYLKVLEADNRAIRSTYDD